MPPVGDQIVIANVIDCFDALIEANQRRIEALEEMASALYREWFVRFRFPGHEVALFVDSELGRIPGDWHIVPFGELVTSVTNSLNPDEIDPDTPYVGLEHIPRHGTTLHDWGRASDVKSRKLRFQPGDILFGKIRPYFHKVVLGPVTGVTSSDTIVLRPIHPQLFGALALGVASSVEFVERAVLTSSGTKMPRASWEVLKRYPVAIPPHETLLRRFNREETAIQELATGLVRVNHRLVALRDLLLPKLVSGESDVSRVDLDELAELMA